jgi:hypothetical protein
LKKADRFLDSPHRSGVLFVAVLTPQLSQQEQREDHEDNGENDAFLHDVKQMEDQRHRRG